MTVSPRNRLASSSLHALFERLQREHFPASRFSEPCDGTVAAQFFHSRLTSAFQPVVRASDGRIAGHHALLRVFSERGAAVAPWSLFAQDSSDRMLVQLDRLTRTLHALNYFRGAHRTSTLFLSVEARLFGIVAEDHGAYFRMILEMLDMSPERVAVVLPASLLDDPVTLVRAAISYRIHGYRVVAQARPMVGADLEHVFLADPHFVAFDAPEPAHADDTRRIIHALSRRGIHSLARRIESAEQAQAARDAGCGFLQGDHFHSATQASHHAAIA